MLYRPGPENFNYKHGLACKTILESEQQDFDEFMQQHSWLEPGSDEAYILYRTLKLLESPGHIPPQVLVFCLDKILGIKVKAKDLLQGKQFNLVVRVEGEYYRRLKEIVQEVLLEYVRPEDRPAVVQRFAALEGSGGVQRPALDGGEYIDVEYSADSDLCPES